ncbi:MAG: hypothetical protein V4623_01010 [Pseudomonadota bacterium]
MLKNPLKDVLIGRAAKLFMIPYKTLLFTLFLNRDTERGSKIRVFAKQNASNSKEKRQSIRAATGSATRQSGSSLMLSLGQGNCPHGTLAIQTKTHPVQAHAQLADV